MSTTTTTPAVYVDIRGMPARLLIAKRQYTFGNQRKVGCVKQLRHSDLANVVTDELNDLSSQIYYEGDVRAEADNNIALTALRIMVVSSARLLYRLNWTDKLNTIALELNLHHMLKVIADWTAKQAWGLSLPPKN
ncbi:TPA: hypothetical protein QFT01_002968 [Enterobacter cloacae]|nr:hypothetical protein [Enterobacter cloacae]